MKKLFEIPYLAEILAVLFIVVLTDSIILSIVLGAITGVVCVEVREKLGIKTDDDEEDLK
jgi:hypothetical protein